MPPGPALKNGLAAEQLLIVPREAACSAGDWLAAGWLAAGVAVSPAVAVSAGSSFYFGIRRRLL